MPIKLKKTDIQNSVDNPKEGYMILGFNERGKLSYKDSDGNYDTVVPTISTGNYERLETEYLTVGYRVLNSDQGIYSIAQGVENIASAPYSFAQGYEATADGETSTARGEYITANGKCAYASGGGLNSVYKIFANGNYSFVHEYANISSGSLSDYSVILGGINHNIGSSSDNSVILGGETNTINSGLRNTAIIASNGKTATLGDSVYIPRIILSNSGNFTSSNIAGTLEWSGGTYNHFRGHNGTDWINLDATGGIATSLSSEISSRISGDASLTTRLSSDISSLTSLSSVVSTIDTSLSTSDTSLSTRLSSEISTRASADSSLTSAISTASIATFISKSLTSDILISAVNTWFTDSSIQVTLSTGTWLIIGVATVIRPGGGYYVFDVNLYNNTTATTLASGEYGTESNPGSQRAGTTITLQAIITVASTATIHLRAKANQTASYIYAITDVYTNSKATAISAIKLN